MKWMEPFLNTGAMAGKIVCPNKKCGAKLGNYDWAGVCCSCKEWVTPVSFFFLFCYSFEAVFHPWLDHYGRKAQRLLTFIALYFTCFCNDVGLLHP